MATRLLGSRVRIVPIPGSAQPKAWACVHSLDRNAGSNPARGTDVCVTCCTVKTKKHAVKKYKEKRRKGIQKTIKKMSLKARVFFLVSAVCCTNIS